MLEWNCTEIYSCIQCLILHSADAAQDHRWNWTYFCGKQIQRKKADPSYGQMYGQK